MVLTGVGRAIVEVLSAAAAFVTVAAFLIPYMGVVAALLIDGVLVIGAVVAYHLWTRSQKPSRESPVRPPMPPVAVLADSASEPRKAIVEQTAVSKSFNVHAGKLTKVELPVEEGDYVFGRLEEVDRQWFSWYIVDIKNLRKAEQKRSFDYEVGEEDVPSTALEWNVRSNGPWYLILDVSMKQYERHVTVNIKRRPRSRL